ncbi:MAG: hypothetical protein HYR60_02400 [Acidobacteria bacterium]|nr:hypothetical protein [Acidobacteriota bacterium]
MSSPVFGRLSDNHGYGAALAAWRVSAFTDMRAMARNLMHDHRVSPEREADFDAFGGRPRSAEAIRRAITDYFQERIRVQKKPAFLDEATNLGNIVFGSAEVRDPLLSDYELARVVDLTGLDRVFSEARRGGMAQFQGFTQETAADSEGRGTNRFLEPWLTTGPERAEEFIEAVLQAMNRFRRTTPHHPSWTTGWLAFRDYIDAGAERWLELVGVPKSVFPRWLIVLRYTVGEAGTVVRPTQLDAGWNAFHFPSPPQAARNVGGHPMDLRTSPPANGLIPEFIHEQIDHRMEHWIRAGGLSGATARVVDGDLASLRRTHHRLLVRSYGTEVLRRMPEAV